MELLKIQRLYYTENFNHQIMMIPFPEAVPDTWEPFGKTYVVPAGAVEAQFSLRHWTGGDHFVHIDAFMVEYGLTSEEGVMLMCLAEALLRIPDSETADALIAEKVGSGKWDDVEKAFAHWAEKLEKYLAKL